MGTIRVSGEGRGQKKADQVELTLIFNTTKADYEQAYQQATEKISRLEAELTDCGFKQEEIMTQRFSVSSDYESFNDEQGRWQQRFKGYLVNQVLQLQFTFENERLQKVIAAVDRSGGKPEVQLNYTVAESKEFQNELLRQAVADATEKAVVLAAAAGKQLGELASISYGQGKSELTSQTEVTPRLSVADNVVFSMPELHPAAIQSHVTVECVWQLQD